MTLNEAIRHLEDKLRTSEMCDECLVEHFQLYNWLIELKVLRAYTDTEYHAEQNDKYNYECAMDRMKELKLRQ